MKETGFLIFCGMRLTSWTKPVLYLTLPVILPCSSSQKGWLQYGTDDFLLNLISANAVCSDSSGSCWELSRAQAFSTVFKTPRVD